MLQYCECGLFKLGNQAYCRIDVEQIVIGYLFAVKLCEHLIEIAEEVAALMGVLTNALLWLHRLLREVPMDHFPRQSN